MKHLLPLTLMFAAVQTLQAQTLRIHNTDGTYTDQHVGLIEYIEIIEEEQSSALTCAQAVALTQALEDGTVSSEEYTVRGYITEVIGSVSRNQQSFWMADTKDGGRVFEAYWANLPEGVTEFTAGTQIELTGSLMKYVKNDTVIPEIKNGTVVILGDEGGNEDDDPSFVVVPHVTIADFLDMQDTETTYEITGTVSTISNTTYGNFFLVEGDSQIYIYGLLDLSGAARQFASLGIEEGDLVTLTGVYVEYNGTPEIKNAQFVSVKKAGNDDDDDDELDNNPSSLLTNGGFETWESETETTGWYPSATSGIGNATISRSSDARTGKWACVIEAYSTANKRLATKEMALEAGTYVFTYYAKSTTSDACQTRAGYVPVVDGAVGSYKYGTFTDITNSTWTPVVYEFTLDEAATVSLIIMNPKNSSYSTSQDIIVDDVTLTRK